jgi:DNA-binding NtrC family response regulator
MRGRSMLVVDDDELSRTTLKDYFADVGYDVTTAVDGEDALRQFSPGKFDCVISDLMMPNINGIELLKRIKLQDKNVFFLMVTGYPSIDNAVDAMKEGAYDYVTKPFHMEDIRLKVERMDNAKKTADSLKTFRNLFWGLIISVPVWLILGIVLGLVWKWK